MTETAPPRPSQDTLVLHEPFQATEIPSPWSSLVAFDAGAASHAGLVRPKNEDSYLVFKTGRSWERMNASSPGQLPERFDEAGYVMAVADGMGGHQAGEVASQLAIKTAVAVVLNNPHWALKLDNPANRLKEIEQTIERAKGYFRAIHGALLERAKDDPSLTTMGTTLTSTYSFGSDLFVMHVGDSRAYVLSGGTLRQLTKDHTLAQEMADAGRMSPEEAQRHRLSHVLTRAIGGGSDEELRTEVEYHELADGDTVLLCTDGLTNMVADAAIAEVLSREGKAQELAEALVERALAGGGKDNVTVVVGKYRIPPRPGARKQG
ncbi:MAG: protein phosphatase 2C domain-containing protein [Gemmataceae bacterium]|nr:protein phosphatase 2C domain-containing protein [Gemmataceae bacterium]